MHQIEALLQAEQSFTTSHNLAPVADWSRILMGQSSCTIMTTRTDNTPT